jgi:hypothetical protein
LNPPEKEKAPLADMKNHYNFSPVGPKLSLIGWFFMSHYLYNFYARIVNVFFGISRYESGHRFEKRNMHYLNHYRPHHYAPNGF